MPARLTREEYGAQVARADTAEAGLKTARAEIADLRRDGQRAAQALANSEHLRRGLETRVSDLEADLAAARGKAAEVSPPEHAGPRADEPRYMYGAERTKRKRLFDDLAAVEAAQEAEPDYWFESPDAARARYFEVQAEEIADE